MRAARLLLGCYRTGDANDSEVYIAAVVRVLSGYPVDVAQRISDPLTGIPSKLKWLPSVQEIVDACEVIEGPRRRNLEWDERAKRQLAERPPPQKPTQSTGKIITYGELPEGVRPIGVFELGRQITYRG